MVDELVTVTVGAVVATLATVSAIGGFSPVELLGAENGELVTVTVTVVAEVVVTVVAKVVVIVAAEVVVMVVAEVVVIVVAEVVVIVVAEVVVTVYVEVVTAVVADVVVTVTETVATADIVVTEPSQRSLVILTGVVVLIDVDVE